MSSDVAYHLRCVVDAKIDYYNNMCVAYVLEQFYIQSLSQDTPDALQKLPEVPRLQ